MNTAAAMSAPVSGYDHAAVLATRRRRAADAIAAIPSGEVWAMCLRHDPMGVVVAQLPLMRTWLRGACESERCAPSARVALDALGALWAVL